LGNIPTTAKEQYIQINLITLPKKIPMKLFVSCFSTLLLCLLLFTLPVSAQSNQQKKVEKALVQYLNKLCNRYTENQLSIDMGTIVQPYNIQNGILSVVRKYKSETDSSVFFVRTSVAITAIEDVFYDYYVGLVGNNKASVTEEKTTNMQLVFEKAGTIHLMHVAPIGDDGPVVQAKLLQLVKDVQAAHKIHN
jgi:hypothetical protein